MKYSLTFNEKQAQVLVDALELYMRVGLGQIGCVADAMWHFAEKTKNYRISEAINSVKRITTGFSEGASYGISSDEMPDRFRQACDIMQVVRHKLAWDEHPEGGTTVNFYEPFKHGKEPLPEIRKDGE